MAPRQPEAEARRRAEVILKVRAGQLSAAEAARQLGMSRKTYYKWEERALAGMLEALCDRSAGRPLAKEDPQDEQLSKRVKELERELEGRRQTEELRRLLKGASGKKE